MVLLIILVLLAPEGSKVAGQSKWQSKNKLRKKTISILKEGVRSLFIFKNILLLFKHRIMTKVNMLRLLEISHIKKVIDYVIRTLQSCP